jgi:hypothetical protein
MPQKAQKQVMTMDKPSATHPAIWRLSSCFIVLFLGGLTDESNAYMASV